MFIRILTVFYFLIVCGIRIYRFCLKISRHLCVFNPLKMVACPNTSLPCDRTFENLNRFKLIQFQSACRKLKNLQDFLLINKPQSTFNYSSHPWL